MTQVSRRVADWVTLVPLALTLWMSDDGGTGGHLVGQVGVTGDKRKSSALEHDVT